MSIIINTAVFIFVCSVFALIVRVLQKIVPVKYFRSVIWGFRNKKYILAPVSVILIFTASALVFSSFNFHIMLLCGDAEGVVVVGQTIDKMIYISLNRRDEGPKEHDLIVQSVTKAYLYPGQTFKDAIHDNVLIKYPGYDQYNILFTSVFVYIFLNLITVMSVFGSFTAGFYLMMYHAAGLGILKKPLKQDEISAYVKKNLGVSILKGLGIVAAFFVASGIVASVISKRYNHVIEYARNAADEARETVLSKAAPGNILTGEVVNRETFAVRTYATRLDEGKTNRRMVSHHFKAYAVKFNDIYDFPVYVSMVYGDRRKLKPEVQKKVDMIEELLRTKGKGTFKVQKDFSIVLESMSE